MAVKMSKVWPVEKYARFISDPQQTVSLQRDAKKGGGVWQVSATFVRCSTNYRLMQLFSVLRAAALFFKRRQHSTCSAGVKPLHGFKWTPDICVCPQCHTHWCTHKPMFMIISCKHHVYCVWLILFVFVGESFSVGEQKVDEGSNKRRQYSLCVSPQSMWQLL